VKQKRSKKNAKSDKLSLEAKVRAVKLWNVDNWNPEDILQDLEKTFGIKFSEKDLKEPSKYLDAVRSEIINSYLQKGPHQQRLIKLLLQAGLIDIKPHY